MVGFLAGTKPGAATAVLMALAAACGTGGPHQAAVSQPRPSRPHAALVRSVTARVKRADFLTGVSCLPAGTCVTVGWYYHGTAGPSLTVAARWNGQAWLTQRAPSRGRDSQLADVSCATPSSCLAVGAPAEAWTGARWSIIPRPPVGGLSAVSCPTPGSCQAVGSSPAGNRPVAARWDGRHWRVEHVPGPAPAPQNLTLAAVSCATPRFCMAVGDASRGAKARPSPSYRDSTLAELWDGSRWRIVPAPNPSHANRLSGVSCPSPAACVAVGSSANGARTLAERWNGARWTVQHTPNIGHIGYAALTAVSCASAADCTAVGTYNGGAFGIAERWDGTRWTIHRLPVPPGPPGGDPGVVPAAVSCTPTACMAVGTAADQTLAERWNGSTWTIMRTPNPA